MSDHDDTEPVAPEEPVAMAAIFWLYVAVMAFGLAASIVIGLAHH